MALYAIGDFHLSFTANKPMDIFGTEWKNHVKKIEKYWKRRITPVSYTHLNKSNIGRRNNQNLVNLPVGEIRKKLEYLCKLYGIHYVLQEESYTSKARCV